MNDEQFQQLLADKKLMDRISRRVCWLTAWEIMKTVGPWVIGFALGTIYGSLRVIFEFYKQSQ